VIRENGGIIRTGILATKTVIKGGRATRGETQNDVCYKAKHVVSNASASATMYGLIGKEHVALAFPLPLPLSRSS
jgi:phytoene dehydrogenase-like protein